MTTSSGPEAPATPLNPSALSVADAAKLLSRVGVERVTPAMIEADRVAGAPANPDGTLHLVNYAAWLTKESLIGD
jgi:hypothetical protein